IMFAALLVACSAASAEGLVTMPTAQLTTVAQFPVGYFLENVAVRADGSMLVTVLNKKELWGWLIRACLPTLHPTRKTRRYAAQSTCWSLLIACSTDLGKRS